MSSCLKNILTKTYKNQILLFQVIIENVWDVFLRHSILPVCKVIYLCVKTTASTINIETNGQVYLFSAGQTVAVVTKVNLYAVIKSRFNYLNVCFYIENETEQKLSP